MAREQQRHSRSFGGQALMKTGFAGYQNLTVALFGCVKESRAAATADRNALEMKIWIAHKTKMRDR